MSDDNDVLDQMSTAELLLGYEARMKKTPTEKRVTGWLKTNLETVTSYWDEFKERHKTICRKKAKLADYEYFTKDIFGEVEAKYNQCRTLILNSLNPGRNQSTLQGDEDNANTVMEVTPRRSPLAPIDLPDFSGAQLEWETFKEMFLALVHNVASLSPILKLQYLLRHLKGDAAKRLKNTRITGSNYEGAWRSLVKRYDNKRVLLAAHMHNVISCPPISKRSVSEINRILDAMEESQRAFKNLDCPTDHWDAWFVYLTAYKLDSTTREEWEKSLGDKEDLPKFKDITDFLETYVRALETTYANDAPAKPKQQQQSTKSHNAVSDVKHSKKARACLLCKEKHPIVYCPKFKDANLQDKLNLVSQHSLCANCLKPNHAAGDCRSAGRCYICHERHHTSIHNRTEGNRGEDARFATASGTHGRSSAMTAIGQTLSHTVSAEQSTLLATAIVEVLNHQGDCVRIRALLDQGSEFSFMSERVADCLSLERMITNINVLGIGGASPGTARALVSCVVRAPHDKSIQFGMEALVLKRLTALIPSTRQQRGDWPHVRGLRLADPTFHTPGRIELIIGADLYGMLLTGNLRRGGEGEPTAQETVFGWVLSGRTSCDSRLPATLAQTTSLTCTLDQTLNESLRKFWEVEEVCVAKPKTPEDVLCEEHFSRTTHRTAEGRFVLRLPLREENPALGDSRGVATALWLQTERRLARNPVLAKLYHDFMHEYLALGHMKPVESEATKDRSFYLPHHGVLTQHKDSKKIRVVFNASQKSSNGKSLNDYLLSGEKLQEDLWVILTRWRAFPVAFVGDVVKMFRQMLIDELDTDLQRIIYRESTEEPLQTFKLATVTYGTTSAPFQAIRVLLRLAEIYEDKYPKAAVLIRRHKYVDDFLVGAYNLKEALEMQTQLILLLKEAGISLGKWAATDDKLLRNKDQLLITSKEFNVVDCVSTLGLTWLPKDDQFCFKVKTPVPTGPVTKRLVSSDSAKNFDPLGWISPVICRFKVLMQDAWICKAGWDDPLPDHLVTCWSKLRDELQDIELIRIPRCYARRPSREVELHGFADASERIYAACLYIVVRDEEQTSSYLLLSKTKVAPIKTLSMPRLELCGVHLLVVLICAFLKGEVIEHECCKVFCYSDSQVVLRWLADHPSRWTTFVATRVSNIQTLLPQATWRYVRSRENPADIATRGSSPKDLRDSNLWWNGPEWLVSGGPPYMQQLIDGSETEDVPEVRVATKFSFVSTSPSEELLVRYSTLLTALRVYAYVNRFIGRVCRKEKPVQDWITAGELKRSRNIIIRKCQQHFFSRELKDLECNTPIDKRSNLHTLIPFLDDAGIIRVGGRLRNADLSFDQRHPIILPKDSYLTRLVIREAHARSLHGGTQLTQSYVAQVYWVIHGKTTIRSEVRACMRCARFSMKPQQQLMGDLPGPRVSGSRAFARTGVDYAGPVNVRVSKGRGQRSYKGYICIFVCMCTKAVHIEVVSDYTAAAFIAAFRRFTSRRGLCAELFSDNGTTFQGANSELARLLDLSTLQREVAPLLANDGTSWYFIPPGSPHFGGLWEAAVKSAKHHIRRVVGETTLTFEELDTLCSQVEACMNSRPLCALSADSQDVSCLTPGHFLVGTPLTAIPEPYDPSEDTRTYASRWAQVTAMRNGFWKRWSTEYLHTLQQRSKWNKPTPNLSIGDLVLITHETLPPTKWPLARILETHPGPDGLVRVVTLKTSTTTLRRPVVKICKLPLPQEIPEQED